MARTFEVFSNQLSFGKYPTLASVKAFMVRGEYRHVFVVERDFQDKEVSTFNVILRNGRLSTDRAC